MSTSDESAASGQANLYNEREKWYAVDFPGGSVEKFVSFWRTNFPGDTFIVLERVRKIDLPPFKVQHVDLKEIARSLEFLGEGGLAVEVERSAFFDPATARHANLWRIGSRHPEEKSLVQMRAVAAPNLFNRVFIPYDDKLKSFLDVANRLDEERTQRLQVLKNREGARSSDEMSTSIRPLKEQKVFVLMGGPEGVAGMESFIQAAEEAINPKP